MSDTPPTPMPLRAGGIERDGRKTAEVVLTGASRDDPVGGVNPYPRQGTGD